MENYVIQVEANKMAIRFHEVKYKLRKLHGWTNKKTSTLALFTISTTTLSEMNSQANFDVNFKIQKNTYLQNCFIN